MVKTRNQVTDEHNYGNFNIKCSLPWELQCDQGGKPWQNLTLTLWHQGQTGCPRPLVSYQDWRQVFQGRCSDGHRWQHGMLRSRSTTFHYADSVKLPGMLWKPHTDLILCLYKDHLYWGHQRWKEDQGIRISTSQWRQLEGQGAACQQSLLYDQGTRLLAGQVMYLRVWEPVHQKVS